MKVSLCAILRACLDQIQLGNKSAKGGVSFIFIGAAVILRLRALTLHAVISRDLRAVISLRCDLDALLSRFPAHGS